MIKMKPHILIIKLIIIPGIDISIINNFIEIEKNKNNLDHKELSKQFANCFFNLLKANYSIEKKNDNDMESGNGKNILTLDQLFYLNSEKIESKFKQIEKWLEGRLALMGEYLLKLYEINKSKTQINELIKVEILSILDKCFRSEHMIYEMKIISKYLFNIINQIKKAKKYYLLGILIIRLKFRDDILNLFETLLQYDTIETIIRITMNEKQKKIFLTRLVKYINNKKFKDTRKRPIIFLRFDLKREIAIWHQRRALELMASKKFSSKVKQINHLLNISQEYFTQINNYSQIYYCKILKHLIKLQLSKPNVILVGLPHKEMINLLNSQSFLFCELFIILESYKLNNIETWQDIIFNQLFKHNNFQCWTDFYNHFPQNEKFFLQICVSFDVYVKTYILSKEELSSLENILDQFLNTFENKVKLYNISKSFQLTRITNLIKRMIPDIEKIIHAFNSEN
ncbi:spatacsin [Anaeramoeba flamelloides]|nr:spatacsin [Anaeramoeba flamelloides]